MSVNVGVMICEKPKPQDTTHSTHNVIDLEGPTGTDRKVSLLTKSDHL